MSKLFRLKLLLAAITSNNAFSPEIFNQVILQLGAIVDGGPQICPDSLAFAVANVLDANPQIRRPLMQSTIERKSERRSSKNGMSVGPISIPQLLPSLNTYEYENSQSAQSIPSYLDLTPQEEVLITLIRNVRSKYSPNTTIRIAGGWVRDKLIYGKETPSRDVDLVLSDVSGKEFANLVCKFVHESKDDDSDAEEKKHVKIQQPAKSNKGQTATQFETATLLINNFEVDFCRLRYEKYTKDSRTPVSISTASVVEDAWRRDLTINSLYYNINSNRVEDWTEKGIRDLILQRIATPKNAFLTLLQDPIRTLRAIRFAAQLSFDMSPELLRAALDPRVKTALQQKVSRDSIGNAIDDMLGAQARDPSRGIKLLMSTNLIDVVFPIENKNVDSRVYIAGLEYLSRTQSLVTRIFFQKPDLEWDITKRRFLWYSAFLKPVYELMSTRLNVNEYSSKRGRRRESVFYQLLDSLKRPKSDVQAIESILKGVDLIQAANTVSPSTIKSQASLKDVSPQSTQWIELSELRWTMYNTLKPIGTLWKEAIILALASTQNDISVCVNDYISLITLIERQLLLGKALINKPKPLLNGSQVRTRVPSLSLIDGREFKGIMLAMEEWQVRNVYCDIESLNVDQRRQLEEQLMEHLVTAFPEYVQR